jgi:hypothetical protein
LSASLLHLRSRLCILAYRLAAPCCFVCPRPMPSVRGRGRGLASRGVGVPVRLPLDCLCPPALVPQLNPSEHPLCVPQGFSLTQVCSVPPLWLHATVAPHLSSGAETPPLPPWALPKAKKKVHLLPSSREPPSGTGRVYRKLAAVIARQPILLATRPARL